MLQGTWYFYIPGTFYIKLKLCVYFTIDTWKFISFFKKIPPKYYNIGFGLKSFQFLSMVHKYYYIKY